MHCSLFIVLSCRSVPDRLNIIDEPGFVALEPGAFAYIFADVNRVRPIMDNLEWSLGSNRQFRRMLDSTDYAAVAVFVRGEEQPPRRFQLAATGNYPAFWAGLYMGPSRRWRRQRSEQTKSRYWHSARSMLSVVLGSRQAFVSAGWDAQAVDPFLTGEGTPIPQGFGEFQRGAIVSCWLDNPGPVINEKLREFFPIEIPAEKIYISLVPADDSENSYTAHLRIQVSNAVQARGLAALFSIARGFISAQTELNGFGMLLSLLFSNPPVQDGSNLIITTNPLNRDEIALLFNAFSL